MTAALLVATAGAGSSPAAGTAFRGGTVLGRLCEQLRELGVHRVCTLAPPEHAAALRAAGHVEAIASMGLAEDSRAVAEFVRAGSGPVLVIDACVVAHREALAGLLAHPGSATAALVATDVRPVNAGAANFDTGTAGAGDAGGDAGAASGGAAANWTADPPVRVEHQRLVSAGSGYHRVSAPNAAFLGAVRVNSATAHTLSRVAGDLAVLAGELDEQRCPADLPTLLLVGLVRAGEHIAAADARELRCVRVTGAEDAAAAEAALTEVDEERVRLRSAVKADDGFFTTHFVSPYSKYLARWAARAGLTPDAVTTISMGIGVVAAACFALGSRAGLIAGALLLQVAFTGDCVDGQLARYIRRFSARGAWLDATFDRAKEYVVYAGLAVGASRAGLSGVWELAVAALALQTLRHMIDFGYAGAHPQILAAVQPRALHERDDGLGGHTHPAPSDGRRGLPDRLGAGAASLSRRLEASRPMRWLKKIVVLPIGERFALISVTAALFDARVTFAALLAWGALAGAYTLAGRVLRSLARPPARAAA